jgi:hypothetical protein
LVAYECLAGCRSNIAAHRNWQRLGNFALTVDGE